MVHDNICGLKRSRKLQIWRQMNDICLISSRPTVAFSPLLSKQPNKKSAQVQHCYITTKWKRNLFYSTNSYAQVGKNKMASGPPAMYRNERRLRWEACTFGGSGLDFSGVCRNSVLCSIHRNLALLDSVSPLAQQTSWFYAFCGWSVRLPNWSASPSARWTDAAVAFWSTSGGLLWTIWGSQSNRPAVSD